MRNIDSSGRPAEKYTYLNEIASGADPAGLSQNTRIYDEKRTFHVISRESKKELASLSRSRLATNRRSRKSIQNLCEIEYFDVSEVANASNF